MKHTINEYSLKLYAFPIFIFVRYEIKKRRKTIIDNKITKESPVLNVKETYFDLFLCIDKILFRAKGIPKLN